MNDSYSDFLKIVADARPILEHGYAVPRKTSHVPRLEIRVPGPIARSNTGSTIKPLVPTVHPEISIPLDLASLSTPEDLEKLSAMIRSCTKCSLCKTRNKAVPGSGSARPLVMVIGEGPGSDEDNLGLPFVGAAGQFLDRWLEAIGLSRYQNTFITNTVKCRPPQNHDPMPEELIACAPYLATQIRLLQPKAILTVGPNAASFLSTRMLEMNEIHGQFFSYQNIPWMPTYHPSEVIRNPALKRTVWEDLKNFRVQILDSLGTNP